jgi:amidase
VSSSGSGVSVAAGLAYGAIGTDTAGSIRFPSTCNRLVGLKPTWGRVSRHGAFPLSHTFDHVGPLTRTAADAALMLGVIAGHDPLDPTSLRHDPGQGWPRLLAPSRLRVGFDERFVTENTLPEVAACVSEVLGMLTEAGADIVPVTLPMTGESVAPYAAILKSDVARAHRGLFPERAQLYGPEQRDLLEQAEAVTRDQLAEAHLFRMAFQDAVADLFTRVDLLVTPSVPLAAPPLGGRVRWDDNLLSFLRYTYHWNLSGSPAVSIPWGLGSDGLPHSVQLIGPHGHEERILSVAAAIERPRMRPPEPS